MAEPLHVPDKMQLETAYVMRQIDLDREEGQEVEIEVYLAEAKEGMRRIMSYVWNRCIADIMSKVGDDGLIDQHRIAHMKNPYDEEKS